MQRLEPLNLRQAEMAARQPRATTKRRRRDPAEQVALLEYRTKIAAFALITQKWSAPLIAIRLRINIRALEVWMDKGCPLAEDMNQLTSNHEVMKQQSNADNHQ
jgi:hypothetical protein